MAVHVLVLRLEVHIGDARSLKDKRSVVRTVVEGARRRYRVAAAETGHHDKWQRAELGFAAVSSERGHAEQVVDEVERFVWSFPELQVLAADRSWAEVEP